MGVPPAVMLWLGVVEAKASGQTLPSAHSLLYAPDRERTPRTGVTTLTTAAMELLGSP